MAAPRKQAIVRRSVAGNIWLSHDAADDGYLATLPVKDLRYEIWSADQVVGRMMFEEIQSVADAKDGPIVIVIVGGRGGQALHRLLGLAAKTDGYDELFS